MQKYLFKTFKADLTLFFVALIWGLGFVVTRQAIGLISPLQLAFYRFLIAGIISIGVFYKRFKKINTHYIKMGFVLGFLLAGGFVFQTVGLAYTSISSNAFLTSANVVFVPFLVWLIFRHPPKLLSFFAALVLILGISLMTLDFRHPFTFNLGDILTLICAVFFALYVVFVGKYVQEASHDALLLHLLELIFAAFLLFLTALVFEGAIRPIPQKAFGSIAYLSVLSTFVCFMLQMIAQKQTAPTRASILISFESVFGTIGSALFLNEVVSTQVYIGCAVVFSAVIIAELGGIQKAEA